MPIHENRGYYSQVVRSGETISRQFHAVLKAILRLHSLLFKNPEPIPDNSTDERWKWFKVLPFKQNNNNKHFQCVFPNLLL